MKRFLPILLTIALMLTMVGCHKSVESSQPSATDPTYYTISPRNREYLGPYLDLDKTHKPSESDILSITAGMHITEVIELLGKPHWIDQESTPDFIWESAEGQLYCLQCWFEDNAPKNLKPIERAVKHSVVVMHAIPWPPNTNPNGSTTEPPKPTDPTVPTDPADAIYP